MKLKTITVPGIVLLAFFIIVGFSLCKPKPKDNPTTETTSKRIMPEELNSPVPGFNFPEDSAVIYGWLSDTTAPGGYDSTSIYEHAWGIWAGLTNTTNQTYANDKLLVFETWMGVNEVRNLIIDGKSACDASYGGREGRTMLTRPNQFEHAANFGGFNVNLALGNTPESNLTQWVTVSYNPAAACFSTQQQIFKQSVINQSYVNNGYGEIPLFPDSAITIKPTYLVYKDTSAGLLQMPVWLGAPNPPDSVLINNFPYCVYIDVTNSQTPNKQLTPVLSTSTDQQAIAAATCNLTDFIYFKVDAKMARLMNQQDSVQGNATALPGQIAVLVGMHVTTKEVANWTWQSYYWTPTPNNPGTPSSQLAVNTRPDKYLKGAAGHYAVVAAYSMLLPNTAKNNTKGAMPMFGYNPYLEGGFGPSTFGLANKYNKNYVYGMQTNCMSCHALAIPAPTGPYTTDQYIDLQDPTLFKNQVKLDFAWSIQTALINDATPYWQNK